MSIVVVGFLAYDTVETPNGKVVEVMGGGASYFSIAARFFSPVSVVAVVGTDYKAEDFQLFTDRNIDVRGVVKREGQTTRWHGRYHEDMNVRDTVKLSLNVLENFTPELLPDQCRADYLYLAPNDPALQEHVLDQVLSPKVVTADLYDYWIQNTRPGLAKVLERIQILLCSDSEARTLTGEHNLVKAGRAILKMGPAHRSDQARRVWRASVQPGRHVRGPRISAGRGRRSYRSGRYLCGRHDGLAGATRAGNRIVAAHGGRVRQRDGVIRCRTLFAGEAISSDLGRDR